jgi:hypothetical protein
MSMISPLFDWHYPESSYLSFTIVSAGRGNANYLLCFIIYSIIRRTRSALSVTSQVWASSMQRRRSPQEDGGGQEAAGGVGTLTTDANLVVVLACNNFVLFFFSSEEWRKRKFSTRFWTCYHHRINHGPRVSWSSSQVIPDLQSCYLPGVPESSMVVKASINLLICSHVICQVFLNPQWL